MNKIIVQNACRTKNLPTKRQLSAWVNQVLAKGRKKIEIVIRFVDLLEITKLNKKYRKKAQPTNILSFQFEPPPGIKSDLLGDLVICVPLIKQEAKTQRKTVTAHLAHLIIHGILHLLGYEHKTARESQKMEALEIKHLKKLGITDPYAAT